MASGEHAFHIDSVDCLFMRDDRFDKPDIVDALLFRFTIDPFSAAIPAAANSIRIGDDKTVPIRKHIEFKYRRFPDERAVAATAMEDKHDWRTGPKVAR